MKNDGRLALLSSWLAAASNTRNLELLELARAQTQRRNRQHASKQQVEQRYDQAAPPSARIRR